MDIDPDEAETIDQLDAAYHPWAESLSEAEGLALRCYQASERAYGLVNGVLRGTVSPNDLDPDETTLVGEVIAGLGSALEKGPLAAPVTVWRGVGSLMATFGAEPADPDALVGTQRRVAGFASCTAVRAVAEEEFADSANGALLRVEVPAGVHAGWLPLVGEPDYADEYELLLEEDLIFEVTAVEEGEGILVIDCEVRL